MNKIRHNLLDPRYRYMYVFLLALAIRVLVILLFSPEFWEYESIASNLLSGKGFSFYHMGIIYRSYCEPFFPFFSACVYFLTHHNVFILELAQAFFSSLICVVVYFIGLRLYGQRVGFLAALLAAFHPGLIIYAVKLHPLTFDALFISFSLLAMIIAAAKLNLRNATLAGLAGGICVMSRPTILLFLPLAMIFILIQNKLGFKKGAGYFFAFAAFCGIIILPWVLRNYAVQGQFMLTRSNTPYVFWLGNNPNFSGSAFTKDGKGVFELAPSALMAKLATLDEVGQNKEFLNAALTHVKQYPLGFIIRTVKKFYYFWWFTPQAGLLYPGIWLILYKMFYILIFASAVWGLYLTFKVRDFGRLNELSIILLALLSISAVQSLFYIETRHRWGVEPVLLVFSAKGFLDLLARMPLIRQTLKDTITVK